MIYETAVLVLVCCVLLLLERGVHWLIYRRPRKEAD